MTLRTILLPAHLCHLPFLLLLKDCLLPPIPAQGRQGIGTTIEILTYLLGKYNSGHKYDELFFRAKNANFDCACGYSAELVMSETLSDNDLLDCIYIIPF